MLIVLITFFVITAVTLSAGYALRGESVVTQRVRQFSGSPMLLAPQTERRSGLLSRALMTIGNGMGGDRSLAHRLSAAGYRDVNAMAIFLGARTILSFGPALAVLVPSVLSGEPLLRVLGTAVLYGASGHMLANLWLKRRMRLRVRQLTRALPDALDLMVVCLEAGLGLNATLAKIGEERSTVNDTLGDEFTLVANELRNGRTRGDALRALAQRNGSDDLKALVGIVIQSDRLGASMAKTLRTHADLLRTKRRQRAEEAARKLPIKILFPLALFILPALFVVTVGPAMLQLGNLTAVTEKR